MSDDEPAVVVRFEGYTYLRHAGMESTQHPDGSETKGGGVYDFVEIRIDGTVRYGEECAHCENIEYENTVDAASIEELSCTVDDEFGIDVAFTDDADR